MKIHEKKIKHIYIGSGKRVCVHYFKFLGNQTEISVQSVVEGNKEPDIFFLIYILFCGSQHFKVI
jgi:hypothetical protein